MYILKCSDNSYYTGVTNDIDRRISEHMEGMDVRSYTYYRRPVKLVYYETFIDPNEAIEFEKQIKGWSRRKKEALIEGNWEKIKIYAECKNHTSHKYYKK